jgi:hypothetical protein
VAQGDAVLRIGKQFSDTNVTSRLLKYFITSALFENILCHVITHFSVCDLKEEPAGN